MSVVELSMEVVFLSTSEKQFSVFHQLLQFVQGRGSTKELAKQNMAQEMMTLQQVHNQKEMTTVATPAPKKQNSLIIKHYKLRMLKGPGLNSLVLHISVFQNSTDRGCKSVQKYAQKSYKRSFIFLFLDKPWAYSITHIRLDYN